MMIRPGLQSDAGEGASLSQRVETRLRIWLAQEAALDTNRRLNEAVILVLAIAMPVNEAFAVLLGRQTIAGTTNDRRPRKLEI